jgi:hypothetical protein
MLKGTGKAFEKEKKRRIDEEIRKKKRPNKTGVGGLRKAKGGQSKRQGNK